MGGVFDEGPVIEGERSCFHELGRRAARQQNRQPNERQGGYEDWKAATRQIEQSKKHAVSSQDEDPRQLIAAEPSPIHAEERRATASGLMEEIAAILFDVREWDQARRTFEKISTRPAFAKEADYMVALCHFRAGRANVALTRLENIPVDEETLAHRVRRLRGDCYMQLRMYEKAIDAWKRDEEDDG